MTSGYQHSDSGDAQRTSFSPDIGEEGERFLAAAVHMFLARNLEEALAEPRAVLCFNCDEYHSWLTPCREVRGGL